MNLSPNLRDPDQIIAFLLSFVIATTIHEFMHAWTAHKLGDNTARELGRITLNPVEHFDPIRLLRHGHDLDRLPVHRLGQAGASQPIPVHPSLRAAPQGGHGACCLRRTALERGPGAC